MSFEVGKKYTDGHEIIEVKFFDYEGTAWGLDEKEVIRFIDKSSRCLWKEATDTPDPGEGWRLLHPDEDVEIGDEYFSDSNGRWMESNNYRTNNCKQTREVTYRRRIAPQYVPYTWEDREELRGRWYRQKEYPEHERLVAHLEIARNEIEINGWGAQKFLQKCEWLDGTPCGKVVV